MERNSIVDTRRIRTAIRPGCPSRPGVQAGRREVSVVEIEQFRVRDGRARLLERIGEGRAVERIEVWEESDEFVSQCRRSVGGRVCQDGRLRYRGNRPHRAIGWGNGRKQHKQKDDEDDMLYPPEYPPYPWHDTHPLKTAQYFRTSPMVAPAMDCVNRALDAKATVRRLRTWMADTSGEVGDARNAYGTQERLRESEDGIRCQYK